MPEPEWDQEGDEDYREVDDDLDDDDWEWRPCSPMKCGKCWGGDGICMQEIDGQMDDDEHFRRTYVKDDISCPGCQVTLRQYRIPTSDLWVWPGTWPDGVSYSPMIAMNIFVAYDAPKGEIHEPVAQGSYCYHHIWVGTVEHRAESLIMLNR